MATGLVLTGGGLRGIAAQVGALVELERRGYRFDAVIGASAGAIVGALYTSLGSARETANRIRGIRREDYLEDVNLIDLLRRQLLDRLTGIHRGAPLLNFLKNNLHPERSRIEQCEPPLMLAVTNLSRSIPEVKTEGPLAEFARASSAVPGLFEIQEVDGEFYVDGGVANNIPVDEIARPRPGLELDQFVVLTSLSTVDERPPVDNSFREDDFPLLEVLERSLMAAANDLALNNLNAGGHPVRIFRVETLDLDLEDADQIDQAIDHAIANAGKQFDQREDELAGITRVP